MSATQDALWVEDVPGGAPPELLVTPHDVAAMTSPQRRARVELLVQHSHMMVDLAIAELVGDKQVAGVVCLWSGGNDSTTLAHLMRPRITHVAHANTGIGIEETRQFVRDTAAAWGVPLIEKMPAERDSYETHVLAHGFPGAAMHFKMYTRLKERQLEQVRNELVSNPRTQRVVYLAGRRRAESRRRASVPEFERKGSIVWSSPMVLWTKLDLNTYRQMRLADGDPVPVNPVTKVFHMSGECLCGAFAAPGELDEIRYWYPAVAEYLDDLAARALANGVHPALCQWGWHGTASTVEQIKALAEARAAGDASRLCTSCEDRAQMALFGGDAS